MHVERNGWLVSIFHKHQINLYTSQMKYNKEGFAFYITSLFLNNLIGICQGAPLQPCLLSHLCAYLWISEWISVSFITNLVGVNCYYLLIIILGIGLYEGHSVIQTLSWTTDCRTVDCFHTSIRKRYCAFHINLLDVNMKFIGILLLQFFLVGIECYRLRPISKGYYRNVLKHYSPRRIPHPSLYWNKQKYLRSKFNNYYNFRKDKLYNLRRTGNQQGYAPMPYVSKLFCFFINVFIGHRSLTGGNGNFTQKKRAISDISIIVIQYIYVIWSKTVDSVKLSKLYIQRNPFLAKFNFLISLSWYMYLH